MKVALVSGSAGDHHCGVGDYAFELAQHLALDATVDLFYAKGHGPAEPPFPKLHSLQLFETGGFSALALPALVKRLRANEYDIVHLQYPSRGFGTATGPAFLPQYLSGMQSRSRMILTLHEWTTSHPLRKLVMDQMLPAIDALIVSNPDELARLAGRMGQRRVNLLPVGNVLSSRRELEAVWLAADGLPVPALAAPGGPGGREPYSVFHYGLPAAGKGLPRLLQALKLARDAGCPLTLYLGGEFIPGTAPTEELLGLITELNLAEAVVRLGHIPWAHLAATAERCQLALFPFDEGFSAKRSSVATLSELDLPIMVGGGSSEDHPYYAPDENTAAALAVLLVDLFTGRLANEWNEQVIRQRAYAQRFSFAALAAAHLKIYRELRRIDA